MQAGTPPRRVTMAGRSGSIVLVYVPLRPFLHVVTVERLGQTAQAFTLIKAIDFIAQALRPASTALLYMPA